MDGLGVCDCVGDGGTLALCEQVTRPLPVDVGLDEPACDPLADVLSERTCDPLPEGVGIELWVTDAVTAADAVGLLVGDTDWVTVVESVLLGVAVRVPESVAAWLGLAVCDEVGL